MFKTIIQGRRIITPDGLQDGYLVLEDGKIISVASGTYGTAEPGTTVIDAGELYVSPGFIDIHTHGGGGHDFMDGDVNCFIEGARMHLRHGTTSIVPTTLTSTTEEIFQSIDHFKTAKNQLADGPFLLGMHLEGPYFNPAQCGAQDPRYIKNPCREEYEKILQYADGAIIRWSVAPELEGALEMGDFLRDNHVVASIGHSNAEYCEVAEAVKHGYTLLTHFYSAMSSIIRKNGFRHLGIIESGYIFDKLDVEIIADGCHLPPELLRMICKLKGIDHITLVTDSMRGAGMPDGESKLGSLKNGQTVLIEDGVAKLMDKSAFAGSVATADRLVRVMHKQGGIDICDAVKMITQNPAQILGISERKGRIAVGLDADLLLFDDDIQIQSVFCNGKQMCL